MKIHVNVNENYEKTKKWNVGKPTLPLNENVVCHRRRAAIGLLQHSDSPLSVATDVE